MALGMEVGLSPGDCVLDGTQLPSPKRGRSLPPQFSAHFYCGQTAGCIKMSLGLSPRDFVVDGDPAPPQEGGGDPQFSVHVYCGQTAAWAWIKMPLGTEVGLGPDDIVLDGEPACPPQEGSGACSPIFGPCLLWPNGWMDQDGTWHGGGPWSRPHCARWGTSSPPPKRGHSPQFSAHFYCHQTAGWIKMTLGMEVGLSLGDFVLDGDPASPPQRGTVPPIFGQCPL